jgi:hypothetical protein
MSNEAPPSYSFDNHELYPSGFAESCSICDDICKCCLLESPYATPLGLCAKCLGNLSEALDPQPTPIQPKAPCNPPGYDEELEREQEIQARVSELKRILGNTPILAAEVKTGITTYSLTTSHRQWGSYEDDFLETICSQPWYSYDSGVIWLDNQTKLELVSEFHGKDLVWRSTSLAIPAHLQM